MQIMVSLQDIYKTHVCIVFNISTCTLREREREREREKWIHVLKVLIDLKTLEFDHLFSS